MYLRGPSEHRRRNAAVAGAVLAALVGATFFWLANHLTRHEPPALRAIEGMVTLDEARELTDYRVYWLGEDIGPLDWFAARHESRPAITTPGGDLLVPGVERVSVAYYGCSGGLPSAANYCRPMMQVTTSPACGAGRAFRGLTGPRAAVQVEAQRIRVFTGKVVVTITGYDRVSGFSAEDVVERLEVLTNGVQPERFLPEPSGVDDCRGPSRTSRVLSETDQLTDWYAVPSTGLPSTLTELVSFKGLPLLWLGPTFRDYELSASLIEPKQRGGRPAGVTLQYGGCGGAWAAAKPTGCIPAVEVAILRGADPVAEGAACQRLPSGAVYRYRPGRVRLWTGSISVLVRDPSLTDQTDAPGLLSRLIPLTAAAQPLAALPPPVQQPCATVLG